MNNKVWIVTREYWEDTTILGVYDSKEKAIRKIQEKNPDLADRFESKDIGNEVTYWVPFDEDKSDYIAREYEIE
jgi:hypothetical protein